MAFYPQMTTGALAQYPCIKKRHTRTTQNISAEGRRVVVADAGYAAVSWELRYAGLTTAEWQEIEGLFGASEGRLGTFGFLDPMDNLLAYSEEFDETVWSRDPLLQVSGGFADALGGTAAFRIVNNGQVTQGLRQAVAGPATFQYCFSLWVRSAAGGPVTFRISSATASQESTVAVGTTWRRCFLFGNLGVDETPVTFGVDLAPGVSADIFGAQADAQPAAAAYRRTLARGGVFGEARFDQDEIAVVTEGPEQHSLMVGIWSRA